MAAGPDRGRQARKHRAGTARAEAGTARGICGSPPGRSRRRGRGAADRRVAPPPARGTRRTR
eukprot:3487477-Pleurochrysis_carterae.AAC.1